MIDSPLEPRHIMFVCLGNHCRSPLAHGYFEHLLEKYDLGNQIKVSSSGTSDWHIGELPDPRVLRVAEKNGISLHHIRGQKITNKDLETCELILVMDRSNLRDVLKLDVEGRHAHKVKLLRTFDSKSNRSEVPDPYYTDTFDEAYTIVSQACDALFEQITNQKMK